MKFAPMTLWINLYDACKELIRLDDAATLGEDVGGEWDYAFDAIRKFLQLIDQEEADK